MPPRRCSETAGVVVGISRPDETIVRHLVPFFACDFACFAADAHGGIGEETDLDIFLHAGVPALVCALCSFANHDSNGVVELMECWSNGADCARSFFHYSITPLLHFVFIPLFPLFREHAKTFRRLARRAAVVQDANSAVVRIAARNARSSREMLGHAASAPG